MQRWASVGKHWVEEVGGAHWWRGGARHRRKRHSPAGRRRAEEVGA
jgi:hypothetical protein